MKALVVSSAVAVVCCANSLMAATYYKVGTDAAGASSFTGNVSGTVGWSPTQGATATTTVSDFENSDFIVGTGTGLRIPATEPDIAFTGRSLTLAGGTIILKRGANGGNRKVAISPFVVNEAGTIAQAQDKSVFTLTGTLDIMPGSTLTFQFGTASGSGDFRPIVVDSAITGDAASAINIAGSGNAGNKSGLTLNAAGDFLGTIKSDGTAPTFSLVINGAFGGTITALPTSTTAVTIDYDGLPAGKGLRVASTTVPPVLKTNLRFYTSSTAIAADGARLLTFPAGTELDASEFSIAYSYTAGGTSVPLPLDVAENDDGTVSLVTKGGGTFYKIGADPADKTSFSTNHTAAIGWAREASATATVPFSAAEMAVSDFIVPSGRVLRTPNTGSAWTFTGRSLRLENSGSDALNQLMLKAANNATITIPNLIVAQGRIFNGNGGYTYTLAGRLSIVSGSSLWICGSDTGTRTIIVNSSIVGDATTSILIPGNGKAGTQVLHFNNAAEFLGAINETAGETSATTLYIGGPFGGTIGALSSKSTLTVNYDGLPAGKGLRVSALSVPDTLKTKLTFYSATANFSQHLLPLISFPAGTTVNPADFTVKHATSSGGAATVLEALTTFTADDGSVVLAVDATKPAAARMVKDADTGSWSWHFYGGDGRDVTATCGLAAPTADTEILFGSTEELAAARANPGTPNGWRMIAFEMTDDADFVTDSFALTVDAGVEIDLEGHVLTLPGSFFENMKSANQQLLVNGGFEADPVDSGAYLEYKPTGWTRGGTVALVSANNSYAYSQRSAGKLCFLNNGANVSQTFTLPVAATVSVSVQAANKNWLRTSDNVTVYTTANGNVQIDGTAVVSWSGPGNASFATRTAVVSLAAGEHTVKVSCTSGSGMAIDNVSVTYPTLGGVITDTVGGGELRVDVPENVISSNTAFDIMGKVKFVKKGAGVFVSRRRGLMYSGGNEIVEGKLTTTEGNGANADWSAKHHPLGATDNPIVVRKNGTLDIAGNYDYRFYPITLDGGTLRSGKLDDSGPINQSQVSWGGVGRLALTADSTFYLRSDVMFSGNDDIPIDLGGHEWLLDCPVGAKTIFMSKDMTNGTIRITPSSEKTTYMRIINRDVDARTVDVIDKGGISPISTFSVRNYTAEREYDNVKCTGTTNLYVYGTFTPRTDYFYGCTMKNGSMIDLRGKDDVWSTTSAATVGKKTVDFEDGAMVTIDVRGRGTRVKVVDWTDHTPENLDTLKFVPDARSRSVGVSLYVKPDGIYVSSGTMIFVR